MINSDMVFVYINQVLSKCPKGFSVEAKNYEKYVSLELESSWLVNS